MANGDASLTAGSVPTKGGGSMKEPRICIKCGSKEVMFGKNAFPMMFHKCQQCGRTLCPDCWKHKHLFAWKYCYDCNPTEYWEEKP